MTKYNEVERKAAVGERIKIVVALDHRYKNGDEFVVERTGPFGLFVQHPQGNVDGCAGIFHNEYVVLEPVTSDPLYESFRKFVAENADGLRKLLADIEQPAKLTTEPDGKLTRAEVIANATADVAELTRKMSSGVPQVDGNYTFQHRITTPEFHVNREKRVVTVLVRHDYGNDAIVERAIAKCSPKDVFHAEIGKAIALRKALRLTVPTEYTNAPQPDEPRSGAKVRKLTGYNKGVPLTLERRTPSFDGPTFGNFAFTTIEGGWIGNKQYEIIDDTDVNYAA